ncbi:type II secretion system secretin GspD [Paraburkholderia phosphatilytica]|uniref:type II secretion system secretin GspD n=1 Tax=Paraburkholderia phosphatilytica TaxID=2282883 RepID=UPI0013E07776|nr:type II secretion system secretin GspD [Paraburkholderia phosphatilytica]
MLATACFTLAAASRTPVAFADATLNFADADISDVAKAIGAATGRTIIVDPRVQGKINLQAEHPVPDDVALKTLEASLRMRGFAMVNDHGLIKVVPEADAKLQGVPTFVGTGQAVGGGDQVVTQIFRLRNESATNILPTLRPLISPNNAISVYAANNSIVVTDYADNIRRIASVINAIDGQNDQDATVIGLQYSSPEDITAELSKILDPNGIGDADATLKVAFVPDDRTNSLIVRASSPARLAKVRSLVAQLDKPTRENGNIHVVYLQHADAKQLAAVLRGILAKSGNGANGKDTTSSDSNSQSKSTLNPPLPTLSSSTLSSSGSTSGIVSSSSSSSDAKDDPFQTKTSDDSSNDVGGGVVTADPADNSLIITAPEPVYRNLRTVITKLDTRRLQVYIESLIVEISSDKSGQFGVQWQGALTSGSNTLYGNSNFNTSSSNGIVNLTAAGLEATTSSSTTSSVLSNLASTSLNNGLNIGLLHQFGSILGLGGLVQALSSNSDVNILSTPNLVTLDNEEAKIVVGQNIPLITGTYTNTTTTTGAFDTYDRKDVGITLHVLPQITAGGVVKMKIYQEDSSVVSGTSTDAGGSTLNKRSLGTTILCDNGQIIVLGGLIQDSYSNGNSKVPWLGDLPLIGNLFRTENKDRTKTELMVFLRPVIIHDAEESRRITMDRYDYMRVQNAGYKTDNRVIRDPNAPQMPSQPPSGNGPLFDWSASETAPQKSEH